MAPAMKLAVVSAQGWRQIGELGLAFVLSSLIGLEREWRQKSAGLRTHTLVGVGAALFVRIGRSGDHVDQRRGVITQQSAAFDQ